MELRVNDYVRTEEFGISRVKWFDNNEPILENGFTALQKEYKSSPNIIDLIEVGDYVNGHRVYGTDDEPKRVYVDSYVEYDNWVSLENDNIKSIVTKEQFESMEYKVKE